MPQALETLCLIQFWSWIIALFPILGEQINEFVGLSLDPRNLLLQESVLQETVLAMEDSPCFNPLAYWPSGVIRIGLPL